MASPVWKGTLSFGLVSLPVRLFSARERHGTRFHQFQRGTSDRIRYRRVNERTGKEVDSSDIVRGTRVDDSGGDEEYVVLEPEDLEDIAPGRSSALEITAFVPAGDVEALWYDSAYYLAPDSKGSAKPYRLLYAALERAGRLGLTTLVLRERQHLAVIGPQNGVLALSTLWWADEIRDPAETLPAIPEADLADRDLDLAEQLIGAMAEEWRPEEYTDDYQERVDELVRAKSTGERVRYAEEGPPRETNVVELTEALRASLGGGKSGGRGGGKGGGRAKGKEGATARGSSGGGARGGAEGAGGGRSGGGKAPEPREAPVAELSKKELVRLAAELDVPGRSKMSREELEEAVTRARGAASGRTRRRARSA
ncbi:Ku protein [Streptomonospora nanhaiensis]|uniref:Non-homologous end joining protein Ku n=1 Tax=Streptomonospora nanhaiensis TaxID=1323731 RepID=A0A853BJ23_9ACTN|nr:Ku protein [Streptomonospora nanhaiensis]MBV2363361.1 Ku protein [Streptomonospora nanhaiensis]MBX9389301.1 Ku protein [Streptomonospora nanhaiensis]NYI94582.1 DNA end-binding protein Ku [Streptomonospora nanhaiensis]